MATWTFFWCNIAADEFTVDGIPFKDNVPGNFVYALALAEVVDPIYGTTQKISVYKREKEDMVLEIACAEWTPGVYVAFANEQTLPLCKPRFRWDSVLKWVRID